jgi:hypothetical protein
MAECEPKVYRCTDGNGGHLWDWVKIKETIIGGLILAIIIATASVIGNRYFNVNRLENKIDTVVKYQRESKNMNLMQNDRINSNTKILYGQFFPKYPCPVDLIWPEEK